MKPNRAFLCRALGLAMLSSSAATLAQEEEAVEPTSAATSPHKYHLEEDGVPVDRAGMFPGEQIVVKLDAADTEGRFTVMDFTFAPGFSSAPGHYHNWHSETFIVIEGRMEFIVEGQKQILGPGDLVYIPPNSYHSARTLDGKAARTIFIFDPAGFEDGIAARNDLTEEQKADPEFMERFNNNVLDYHFDPARGHDHDAPDAVSGD